MTVLGTIALTSADVAFFSPPPHRPGRPERRNSGGKGVARTLVRALRRQVALALADAHNDRVRVSNRYPY